MLHKASAFSVSANELGVQFVFGWPAICTRLRANCMQIVAQSMLLCRAICMLFLQPFACLSSTGCLQARTMACGWGWKLEEKRAPCMGNERRKFRRVQPKKGLAVGNSRQRQPEQGMAVGNSRQHQPKRKISVGNSRQCQPKRGESVGNSRQHQPKWGERVGNFRQHQPKKGMEVGNSQQPFPSWVCAQRLSPYALFIFNHLGLQRRIGLGIAVVALLKLLLCIEKVVHRDGSCLIEIAVEAQVFFALVDAFLGQEQLFVGIIYFLFCCQWCKIRHIKPTINV